MERRLAAIVAMDVAGYSRLMGADEAGTHRALRDDIETVIEPALTRHGGRVERINGDDVLVEFPSAVQAVTAAAEMQSALRGREGSLVWRIGIHAGEICADGASLFGDTVNTAFRLEAAAPGGGILISAVVQGYLGKRLDLTVVPEGFLRLKNLREPVMAYRVEPGAQSGRWPVLRAWTRQMWPRVTLVALGALLMTLAALSAFGPAPRPADQGVSIAVLPFASDTDVPERKGFATGLAYDIITDLSRFQGLAVASATSSIARADQRQDAAGIGRELGVRFVLEGHIQWMVDRIRVNAILVETARDRRVWSDRYEYDLALLDTAQAEIARNIASELGPAGEGRGPVGPAVLGGIVLRPPAERLPHELYKLGVNAFERFDREGLAEAKMYLDQAVANDPFYTLAHAKLAMVHLLEYRLGWSADPAASLAAAAAQIEAATGTETRFAENYQTLGAVRLFQRKFDEADEAFRHALRLNPNDVDVVVRYGWAKTFMGHAEDGLAMIRGVIARTPHARDRYQYELAWALFMLGRYGEAALALDRTVQSTSETRLLQALISARLQQRDAAAAAISTFRAEEPDFTRAMADRLMPFRLNRDRDHYLETLAMAGIPAE